MQRRSNVSRFFLISLIRNRLSVVKCIWETLKSGSCPVNFLLQCHDRFRPSLNIFETETLLTVQWLNGFVLPVLRLPPLRRRVGEICALFSYNPPFLHTNHRCMNNSFIHLFILSFTFSFLSPQFQCLENKPHENCAHCHGSAKTILAVRNMSSSCKINSINASTQCLPYNAPKIRIRSANTHHTELQCMSAKDMKTLTHRVHPSSSTDQE